MSSLTDEQFDIVLLECHLQLCIPSITVCGNMYKMMLINSIYVISLVCIVVWDLG